MIPASEKELTCQEVARWRLTQMAAALVRDGVPADLVMVDAREGVELAQRMARSPR